MTMPKPNASATTSPVSPRMSSDEPLTPKELRAWMNKEGISDKNLAAIFGVTKNAVTLWLDGKRQFSLTNSRIIRFFIKYPKLLRDF